MPFLLEVLQNVHHLYSTKRWSSPLPKLFFHLKPRHSAVTHGCASSTPHASGVSKAPSNKLSETISLRRSYTDLKLPHLAIRRAAGTAVPALPAPGRYRAVACPRRKAFRLPCKPPDNPCMFPQTGVGVTCSLLARASNSLSKKSKRIYKSLRLGSVDTPSTARNSRRASSSA